MERELETLILELKSEKPNNRKKAYTRLDSILNSREDELKEIAQNNRYLSFDEIFFAAHAGVKKVRISTNF